jgi:hypothetical protein
LRHRTSSVIVLILPVNRVSADAETVSNRRLIVDANVGAQGSVDIPRQSGILTRLAPER